MTQRQLVMALIILATFCAVIVFVFAR